MLCDRSSAFHIVFRVIKPKTQTCLPYSVPPSRQMSHVNTLSQGESVICEVKLSRHMVSRRGLDQSHAWAAASPQCRYESSVSHRIINVMLWWTHLCTSRGEDHISKWKSPLLRTKHKNGRDEKLRHRWQKEEWIQYNSLCERSSQWKGLATGCWCHQFWVKRHSNMFWGLIYKRCVRSKDGVRQFLSNVCDL